MNLKLTCLALLAISLSAASAEENKESAVIAGETTTSVEPVITSVEEVCIPVEVVATGQIVCVHAEAVAEAKEVSEVVDAEVVVIEEVDSEGEVVAEEIVIITKEPEKSPFEISVEFGALIKTGDTESGDIKSGFDIDYDKDQWRSALRFDLLVRRLEVEDENGDDEYETSDQKWSIVSQTNYTLEPEGKNYIFGNVSYEDDRFSSFDSQSSFSAGWGRRWYETEISSLDADIGPGYKRDRVKATDTEDEETKDALIIQAQALYKHKFNEHVEFKQLLVAKYATDSAENSVYKAQTSISTKLIETLQLKFTYTLDHNTEVDSDKENTNTETAMTLVYSF